MDKKFFNWWIRVKSLDSSLRMLPVKFLVVLVPFDTIQLIWEDLVITLQSHRIPDLPSFNLTFTTSWIRKFNLWIFTVLSNIYLCILREDQGFDVKSWNVINKREEEEHFTKEDFVIIHLRRTWEWSITDQPLIGRGCGWLIIWPSSNLWRQLSVWPLRTKLAMFACSGPEKDVSPPFVRLFTVQLCPRLASSVS